MPVSARFYLCARCRLQTFICSACDRGQIYCTGECAAASRSQAQQQARQRYNKTRRARALNAERQQRYRLRQRTQETQRVTDQGSRTKPVNALSSARIEKRAAVRSTLAAPLTGIVVCRFCARECAPGVRLGFLPIEHRRPNVAKRPP